jgi:peroxiredoxin family protein
MSENIQELQAAVEELKNTVTDLEERVPQDKLSMVVFSGDLDKIIAAFIIGTGAAAMGSEVVMFFTFWGTAALRDKNKKGKGKDFISKMFGFMLPRGSKKLKLSKMNMAGMGPKMIRGLMKKKGVKSVEELIKIAGESGVKIYVCEMTMNLMGMKPEEMIDYPDLKYCGVAKFLSESETTNVNLFI